MAVAKKTTKKPVVDLPPQPKRLVEESPVVLPPVPTLPSKKDWAWEDGELGKCAVSCEYFLRNYCYIDDKNTGDIFKFELWPLQVPVLNTLLVERQVIALKPRQVGVTWLDLCKDLWVGLFEKPSCSLLFFSLRDEEAKEMLSRIKRVYKRLPRWMQCKGRDKDDTHELRLSNGTEFKSFPTGVGDSYTAAGVLLDEFDLLEPAMQLRMYKSIKPTVDAGGRLVIVSKANKTSKWDNSLFKSIYREARTGNSRWKSVFMPWWARPDRTQEWYDAEKRETFNITGSYDALHENYPESEEQALAPSSGDKRFAIEWLNRCNRHLHPANPNELRELVPQLTHIKGVRVYKDPAYARKYVGGCDPAEGTAGSNPSALVLVDASTGEEVLSLNEKLSPARTAKVMEDISSVYNKANWLVERNNHGGTVIQEIESRTEVRLIDGPDKRAGWPSNKKTKTELFNDVAEMVREGMAIIHSFDLYSQLSKVEGQTLESPIGEGNTHGDLAMAFVLALKGTLLDKYGTFKDSDFQWDTSMSSSSPSPFGARDSNRRGGGTGMGGGGGHNPFGAR